MPRLEILNTNRKIEIPLKLHDQKETLRNKVADESECCPPLPELYPAQHVLLIKGLRQLVLTTVVGRPSNSEGCKFSKR
jgi:hypothetical protein